MTTQTKHREPGALHRFMFATGIENSYPTISGKDGKAIRRDELESTGFYTHWREDFDLLGELEIDYLRYGPQYYRVHVSADRYDWDFCDVTFARLKEMGIAPIADLCHFGLPDWIGSYQNPDFPQLFAGYARTFAQRYPWVKLVTPVNEIFVNATFSAQHGWWNDRLRGDRSFVTALKHMCKANLRAEEEILKVQPKAIFIQSEATAYYHERTRAAGRRARTENEKRFLSFDLSYGHRVNSEMYEYLCDNGMRREEYHWFLEHGDSLRPHCVMGSDYYGGNEHWVTAEGQIESAGPVFGYAALARQYFDRYHLPVMLTETNVMDAQRGPDWLHDQWACIRELRRLYIPVVGFTWYSLLDQVDWDVSLREVHNKDNPVGLYDLDRKPRPVRDAYRQLIAEWRDQAPLDVEYG